MGCDGHVEGDVGICDCWPGRCELRGVVPLDVAGRDLVACFR